ncbi:MAG: hypothetical protein R6X18_09705 [Chloroflexota bacterium]|jgi:hypothetical protein
MPERQNRWSSSWWFFLLFPEGPEGFGPRQLMFTIATRAGQRIRINGTWLAGLDRYRQIANGRDTFEAMTVGWYCDGQAVHDEYVRFAGPATIDSELGRIACHEQGEPNQFVAFQRSRTRPVEMEAVIRIKGATAGFSVWGALDTPTTSPSVNVDIDTFFGGSHYIGWRRLNFRGNFELPSGEETLQGVGFFQRVCLNVPVFPWKWIWAVFPDQSLFTAYVPYLGLNLFRKGYHFFHSNRLEQTTIPIVQSAKWISPGSTEPIHFNRISATPILGQGPHPLFTIKATNQQGDHISFTAVPYGLSRFYIDRPILGRLVESHWNYNEYMFRMESLIGSINGQTVTRETRGQAFGSLEYAYGLGL